MACICIEIKERIEREKKSIPQGEKDGKHHCMAHRRRVTASKTLGMDRWKFLKKSKRKFSHKGEKRKREMEKF